MCPPPPPPPPPPTHTHTHTHCKIWDYLGNKYGRNMGFFMIILEKYGRLGEIILKTGGDAILTVFAPIFSRTPADFVLYFPIFFLNEKKIEMDSVDE